MAKVETTKDRLTGVIADDRKRRMEQPDRQPATDDGCDQTSRAERVAKNIALLRSYETPNK